MEENCDGLMNKDSPVFVEVGHTVNTRFEVNQPTVFSDTLMLIGCAVAGIPAKRVPGESVEVELPGWGLRSRVSVTNHRLACTPQEDHSGQARHRGCEARQEIRESTSQYFNRSDDNSVNVPRRRCKGHRSIQTTQCGGLGRVASELRTYASLRTNKSQPEVGKHDCSTCPPTKRFTHAPTYNIYLL